MRVLGYDRLLVGRVLGTLESRESRRHADDEGVASWHVDDEGVASWHDPITREGAEEEGDV